MRVKYGLLIALMIVLPAAVAGGEESLRGSRASMVRQNAIAKANDYSFLRTPAQVAKSVEDGYLIQVSGNEHYRLSGVSYPYARAEIKLFIERLAEEHHNACGEPLVVTSLTRPLSRQPKNAHKLSVHPAGMAVDLRVSGNEACRDWLEQALLALEAEDLLDVTREYRPPHFHVAVFPAEYRAFVSAQLDAELARQEREAAALAAAAETLEPTVHEAAITAVLLAAPRWAALPPVLGALGLALTGLFRRRRRTR